MIEVRHIWAATAGPSPHDAASCPLHEGWRDSLKALEAMRKGLAPNATDFALVHASMAWRIPEEDTTMWWRLTAQANTAWRPADPGADLDHLTTQALQLLSKDRRVRVAGNHPGTEATTPQTTRQARIAWIATPTGADPNDPDIYPLDLHFAGHPGSSHAQALESYHAQREDLLNAGMDDAVGPETDFTLWWRLQLDAETTWMPQDAHIDPKTWALGLLTP